MTFRLRHKVNLAILAACIIIATLFAVIEIPFLNERQNRFMGQVRTILTTMVERDSETLAHAIFENRTRAVNYRLQQMLQTDGVRHICIFDAKGKVIASGGPLSPCPELSSEDRQNAADKGVFKKIQADDQDLLFHIKELKTFGEHIGFIRIYYSLSEIAKDRTAGFLIFGGLLSSILIFLPVLLNLLLTRAIVSPVITLQRAAQIIANGNLNTDVHINRTDEIGELAASFIEMRDAVARKIDELNRSNRDLTTAKQDLEEFNLTLEKKVAERTQELAYSERFLAAAQGIASLGNWIWDVASGTWYWSDELYRIFGIEPGNAIPSYEEFLRHVHPEDRQRVEQITTCALSKNTQFQIDHRIVPQNSGIVRIVQERGSVVLDSNNMPVRWIGTVQDITEQKRSELELEKAKQTAEKANMAKSIFLANMSHELRTPLNAILGFSELMKRDPVVSDEQCQNLDIIGRSGEHLLSLINDILEFSRIEADRAALDIGIFDLQQLLSDLERMFQLRVSQKGLTLNIHCEEGVLPHIRTDQRRLNQILINLLNNAVKFTESGGITLAVKKEGQASENLRLSFQVTDTGIGIPEAEQDKIFNAFYQTEIHDAYRHGTGLGLAISQKFAGLLGGKLSVESSVGKGTRFTLNIPVEPGMPAMLDSPAPFEKVIALAEGQPAFRILVAEDDEISRALLVRLLRSVGFNVQEATNGREAVNTFETYTPHLIWMDMRMPVMDGYQAAQKIKGAGKKTVIIALTAGAFEEDRLKAIEHGCKDFVKKPFKAHEIFEMLHKHLGVKFIYEPPAEKSVPNPSLSDCDLKKAFNALPDAFIKDFQSAVEALDFDHSLALLENAKIADQALSDFLKDKVKAYQFDLLHILF